MSANEDVNRHDRRKGRSLDELTKMIEARPPEVRVPILQAALSFTSLELFDCEYLIGAYRSPLSDCLLEVTGYGLDTQTCQRLDGRGLGKRLKPFGNLRGSLQIELALSDLLEFLIHQMEG